MKISARWKDILDKIAFVLLAVIFFDCSAFGGGSLIKVFGLDFRMACYIAFFVVSLPLVLTHLRDLFTSKMLLAVLAWGVWFVIATCNGILKGHRLDLIISSWIGFASFVLLPGALCVLRSKKRILMLMKVSILASLVLAAQTVFVLLAYQILPGKEFDKLNLFILFRELGGCSAVDSTIVRVFLRSHPLMIVSCAFSVYFAVREESGRNWFYCGCIALSLFSMMLCYTRSVYFGIFVAVAGIGVYYTFCVDAPTRKNFYKVLGKSVTAFLVLLLVCDLALQGMFLSYGIYRTTGVDVAAKVCDVIGITPPQRFESDPKQETLPPETMDPTEMTDPDESTRPAEAPSPFDSMVDLNIRSDNIRQATQDELFEKIKQKPLTGHGVGAMLKVRPQGDNEYFFLDVAFKMGLIGCGLFVLPILIMISYCMRTLVKKQLILGEVCAPWLIGLLGIVGFSWFNPYLNGTNGIVLYCLTICVFSYFTDNW